MNASCPFSLFLDPFFIVILFLYCGILPLIVGKHSKIISVTLVLIALFLSIYQKFSKCGSNNLIQSLLDISISNTQYTFFGSILIILSLLALILKQELSLELFCLYVFGSIGGLLSFYTMDFLSFFVCLEVVSITGYAVCYKKSDTNSARTAFQYFILGSIASFLYLFGVANIFLAHLSVDFNTVSTLLSDRQSVLGLGFIILSLFFKLGLAPFNVWVRSVYGNIEPTPLLFISTIPKIVVVGLLVRLSSVFSESEIFSYLVWSISLYSVLYGALLAFRDRSSILLTLGLGGITQIGYLLIALLGSDFKTVDKAVTIFMVGYILSTIAILFTVNSKEHDTKLNTSETITCIAALTSFMGLPPFLFHLYGKISVFSIGINSGYTGLVTCALGASALSFYFYGSWIVKLWKDRKEGYSFVSTVLAILLFAATFIRV